MLTGAEAAHVRSGPYHFFTFPAGGQRAGGELPRGDRGHAALTSAAAVDVEFVGNCREPPAPNVIREQLNVWLEKVEGQTGSRVVIYSTPDAVTALLQGIDRPLWIPAPSRASPPTRGASGSSTPAACRASRAQSTSTCFGARRQSWSHCSNPPAEAVTGQLDLERIEGLAKRVVGSCSDRLCGPLDSGAEDPLDVPGDRRLQLAAREVEPDCAKVAQRLLVLKQTLEPGVGEGLVHGADVVKVEPRELTKQRRLHQLVELVGGERTRRRDGQLLQRWQLRVECSKTHGRAAHEPQRFHVRQLESALHCMGDVGGGRGGFATFATLQR